MPDMVHDGHPVFRGKQALGDAPVHIVVHTTQAGPDHPVAGWTVQHLDGGLMRHLMFSMEPQELLMMSLHLALLAGKLGAQVDGQP